MGWKGKSDEVAQMSVYRSYNQIVYPFVKSLLRRLGRLDGLVLQHLGIPGGKFRRNRDVGEAELEVAVVAFTYACQQDLFAPFELHPTYPIAQTTVTSPIVISAGPLRVSAFDSRSFNAFWILRI